jgi:hypothetical protein
VRRPDYSRFIRYRSLCACGRHTNDCREQCIHDLFIQKGCLASSSLLQLGYRTKPKRLDVLFEDGARRAAEFAKASCRRC